VLPKSDDIDDEGSHVARRLLRDGEDIEEVSDTVLEQKVRVRAGGGGGGGGGGGASAFSGSLMRAHPIREAAAARSLLSLPQQYAATAAACDASATLPAAAVAPVTTVNVTSARRKRRSHAERVAGAKTCADARTLFWSRESMAAVQRAAAADAVPRQSVSLGDCRRCVIATYARVVDVFDATVSEVATNEIELVCQLECDTVRAVLSVSATVEESVRRQLETAHKVTLRRVQCDDAQLLIIDEKPCLLYSLSWCDETKIA
jgi:hypothetical protein